MSMSSMSDATVANTFSPDVAAARRVVLIEDSEDLRGMLRELLAYCGHEVRTAATGRDGIALVESGPTHFVLIDLGLPDMDGCEVARRLRESSAGKEIQIVAVTGRADDAARDEALAAGFNHYLVKPVNLATLAAILGSPPPRVTGG